MAGKGSFLDLEKDSAHLTAGYSLSFASLFSLALIHISVYFWILG